MKNVKRGLERAALSLAILLGAMNVEAAGTSSAQFLKLGAGAKAAAMGDAFVGIADDATATYWNPAGLSQIESAQMSLMHNSYLQDSQYQYLGAALPYGNSGLGLSFQRLDFGSIERYSASDVKEGSFEAGSMAAGLSLGMRLQEHLSAGLTVKYLQESIESEKATSFAGDFGFLMKRGRLGLGAAYQNLGPGLKMVEDKAALPQTLRVGASYALMNGALVLGVCASKPNDEKVSVQAGTQYQLGVIAFRTGYIATPGQSLNLGGFTGLTGGLGLQFNRFNLDYAFVPFGDLGLTHRVSFGIKFLSSRN